MALQERTENILKILNTHKYITTKSLSMELYCSESTIRRDLIELEKKGLVTRYHGGVTLAPKSNVEQPYFFREIKNLKAKKHIAKLIKPFIKNGDSLFLDSSSTVLNICLELNEFIHLTIITNGIKTSLELNKKNNINSFLTGGKIKLNSSSIVGELTSKFIRNFKCNLAVISCRGIDNNGIYEADHEQALVKKHMINNSDKTILLCDDSKFEKYHFFKLASFTEIDLIITNTKPSKRILKVLEKYNTKIIW